MTQYVKKLKLHKMKIDSYVEKLISNCEILAVCEGKNYGT